MGSSQSNIPQPPSEASSRQPSPPNDNGSQENASTAPLDKDRTIPKKKPKKERQGYDLVQYKCRKRKAAYDKCYNEWYNQKFLTAKDINRDDSCDELFDIWKECILKGMVYERKRQGLGPPKEGSILGEYLEEQRDE
jgi:hypothetical protein